MSITSKKINLSNFLERQEYSKKLQEFEKEFTYPLGDEKFYIKHGEKNDYFSFFEKLGKPNIMILEDNKKVIGVCCAVLREINHKKYWYLCDFKINKDYRGQKLYRKLMWKYFLPSYLKSQNAFAINMSSPNGNKLFNHMEKIFKIFKINISANYLYTLNGENINKFNEIFWNKHLIVTNNGDKDIIINDESKKLFHIISYDHYQNNAYKFKKVMPHQINNEDTVMYLSDKKLDINFASEEIISNFAKGNSLKISSAEI